MTYPETIEVANPDMRERLDAPGGFAAYTVADTDAESPRDWDCNVARLAQTDSRYLQPDACDAVSDALTQAWERYRDHDMTERYARVYLDAVAYGSLSANWGHGSTVIGVVTREDAEREGVEDAQRALEQELDTYRQWCEGEVVGVIAVRESDGESAALWGVFPDGDYVQVVLSDLLSELGA